MSGLLIVGASVAYALCALVCARLVAGHLAYRMRDVAKRKYPRIAPDMPSGEQWLGAMIGGTLLGVVWPLTMLMAKLDVDRFAIGAEAVEIRRRQEARIAELEKALDA